MSVAQQNRQAIEMARRLFGDWPETGARRYNARPLFAAHRWVGTLVEVSRATGGVGQIVVWGFGLCEVRASERPTADAELSAGTWWQSRVDQPYWLVVRDAPAPLRASPALYANAKGAARGRPTAEARRERFSGFRNFAAADIAPPA